MNDDGPDLQRLFANYEPAITAEPFLDQTLVSLHREIRRAHRQAVAGYACSALVVLGLVAATAVPLTHFMRALETSLTAVAGGLSPVMAQVVIYAATLLVLALARRRLEAFLAPW